jgi:hypothetical protein
VVLTALRAGSARRADRAGNLKTLVTSLNKFDGV